MELLLIGLLILLPFEGLGVRPRFRYPDDGYGPSSLLLAIVLMILIVVLVRRRRV